MASPPHSRDRAEPMGVVRGLCWALERGPRTRETQLLLLWSLGFRKAQVKHGCDTCPHGPEQAEMQCSLAVTMAVRECPEDSSRR